MDNKFKYFFSNFVRHLEYALAITVIIGIIITFAINVRVFTEMDWRTIDTFYEMIRFILALVIGLEFVRMLITHKLNIVLELLAFVIARKLLLPDVSATDIIFSVTAFVVLMIARHFMFKDDRIVEKEEEKAFR